MDYKDFNRYGDEIRTAVKQERMSQVLLGLKGKERQWYEANREWLVKKWIFGKTRAAQDFKIFVTHKPGGFDRAPEIKEYQMQIFRTRRVVSKFEPGGKIFVEKQAEHIEMILRSAVFGLGLNRKLGWEGAEFAEMMMSGFVEQKGRLPTPHDEVEMVYLGGHGIKRWMEVGRFRFDNSGAEEFVITSECCLIAK